VTVWVVLVQGTLVAVLGHEPSQGEMRMRAGMPGGYGDGAGSKDVKAVRVEVEP
jgi:hypothetical protein